MLLLLFKIGEGHFAMAASQVKEVVPRVALTTIPGAPDYTAGLMDYRGTLVPVIDLSYLATGTPAALKISSRIILVDYTFADGRADIIGLLAEHVVETATSKQPVTASTTVTLDDLHYRPATMLRSNDTIQLFDLQRMLPTREINTFFSQLWEKQASDKPQVDQNR
jgi:chemotaxis-related protein WspB